MINLTHKNKPVKLETLSTPIGFNFDCFFGPPYFVKTYSFADFPNHFLMTALVKANGSLDLLMSKRR